MSISGGLLSALTWDSYRAIKKDIAVNLFSKLGWELGDTSNISNNIAIILTTV